MFDSGENGSPQDWRMMSQAILVKALMRKRAAWFRYCQQRDRTAACHARTVPLEHRGTVSAGRFSYDADLSDTDRISSYRSILCRGADAIASRKIGKAIEPVRTSTVRAKRALVSPARFAAWYLPFTLPKAYKPITEAYAALVEAGLVDVDYRSPITPEIGQVFYRVTPRDAVPEWEYLTHLTPAKSADVLPFLNPGRQITTAPVTIDERIRRVITGRYSRIMVPQGVYFQSCLDTMASTPQGNKMRGMAGVILKENGERNSAPDQYVERFGRWVPKSDPVAMHAEERWVSPAPMRYEIGALKVKGVKGGYVPNLGKVHIGTDGQYELRTTLAWWLTCSCGAMGRHVWLSFSDHARRPYAERLADPSVTVAGDECSCNRLGWLGHRFQTFPAPRASQRASAKDERTEAIENGEATSAIGPNRSPWNVGSDNLARTAKKVEAEWQEIEAILQAAVIGSSLTFQNGTVVTMLEKHRVEYRGQAWGARDFARRAALASLTLDKESTAPQ